MLQKGALSSTSTAQTGHFFINQPVKTIA